MCLSGREWNRIWHFGRPDLAVSSGESEIQDGVGALPITSISFPDALDQGPQTDFKSRFWLIISDDLRAYIVECSELSSISDVCCGHLGSGGEWF